MSRSRYGSNADEFDIQINITTNESLASTRRMLGIAEETTEVGIKTLAILDDQGAQLERVDDALQTINADMRETEKHLNKMQKWCGMCIWPFRRRKQYEKAEQSTSEWKSSSRNVSEVPRILPLPRTPSQKSQQQKLQTRRNSGKPILGGYVTKITNDEREVEMDQNLMAIDALVGNLRNMAIDMHAEITQQDQLISHIGNLVQANDERMKDTNKRVTRLIVE